MPVRRRYPWAVVVCALTCGAGAFHLGCSAGAFVSERSPRSALQVEDVLGADVTLRSSLQGDPLLRFTLRNNGREQLELPVAELPWGFIYAPTVILVPLGGSSRAIEPCYPLVSPPLGSVFLGPGGQTEGDYQLLRRYPDIQGVLARRDVAVFWTCQIKPVGRPAVPRVGGWFVIPRQGTGPFPDELGTEWWNSDASESLDAPAARADGQGE